MSPIFRTRLLDLSPFLLRKHDPNSSPPFNHSTSEGVNCAVTRRWNSGDSETTAVSECLPNNRKYSWCETCSLSLSL